MKTLHHASEDKIQWPEFWTEDWIKLAIEELDKHNLDPEELLQYEMTLSANALAVKNEKKKIAKNTAKVVAVTMALLSGKLTVEEVAEGNDVPVEFVLDVQRQME